MLHSRRLCHSRIRRHSQGRGQRGHSHSRRQSRSQGRHRGSKQGTAKCIHCKWNSIHNYSRSSQSIRSNRIRRRQILRNRSLHRSHSLHCNRRIRHSRSHLRSRSYRRNRRNRRIRNPRSNFRCSFCSFGASFDNFHTVRYEESPDFVTDFGKK